MPDPGPTVVFDSLPGEAALVAADGTIEAVNSGWKEFALKNHLASPHFGLGLNYFDICAEVRGSARDQAVQVTEGMRAVSRGHWPSFALSYPCFSQKKEVWRRVHITATNDSGKILMVHLDPGKDPLEASEIEELEILTQVNQKLLIRQEPAQVMKEISEIIQRRCDLFLVSVYLLDEPEESLSRLAHSGYVIPDDHQKIVTGGPGMIATAARTGKEIYLADVSRAENYLVGDKRVQSEYSVPLINRDQVLGVINCESDRLSGITFQQRRLIRRLAAQAAIALDQSESYRQLKWSEARLRSLLEKSPNPVWVFDTKLCVVAASRLARRLLGLGAEQAIGQRVEPLLVEPFRSAIMRHLGDVLSGQTIRTEIPLAIRGSSRTLSCSFFPLRDDKGSVISIGVWARGMTRLKRPESRTGGP